MTKPFRAFLLVLIPVVVATWMLQDDDAQALSNPQTTGSNNNFRVPNNFPIQIPAAGANCSMTLQVDFDPPGDAGVRITTPVCSGYSPTTPLVPLTRDNCIMNICTDPAHCVGTWVTRDTKPGVLWAMALDAPDDAGVTIRVERGAGCQGP